MIYTSPFPGVELPVCSVWEQAWSNPNNIPDNAVALIDGPTGRSVTRGEARTRSQQIAYGYRELGIQKGEVICVFSPNSIDYLPMLMGAQCAGCIFSGANASYTAEELAHQLRDSGSVVLMCYPGLIDVAFEATRAIGWSEARQRDRILLAVDADEAGNSPYRSLSDLTKTGNELPPVPIESPKTTVAYLGYSSGTSGKAKGVRTTHYNKTSALAILSPHPVTENDTHLAVLPFNHIYGLSALLHHPLIYGAKVVVMPKFDMVQFCELVQRCQHLGRIAVNINGADLWSVHYRMSAAAPLSKEIATELSKRLDCSVTQAYGLTETSPSAILCPVENPTPGSIGALLPHTRARIVDPESGKDVGPGEQGEIWLQGPTVMLGYLNRPEANEEVFYEDKDGRWFKTGDIAWIDENGYYYITDRLKELIKYKGFQVAPAELEATCLECPYVADVAVIGVWDEDQATELPRAYIVLNEEGMKQHRAAKAVRDWVDKKVNPHKKLRGGVTLVDMIPKSPSGKILRRILREQARAEEARAKGSSEKAKM